MKISDLIPRWGRNAHPPLAGKLYHTQLSLRDAARIEALQIMYPDCTEEEILSDLLHAALDELEVAMPYVPGKRIIAEDDQGDPIYEDLGPTPRFYSLSHELMRKLAGEKPNGGK
jgi:hypothetical protein